jgi:uncharacterized protein (DUF1697 family)
MPRYAVLLRAISNVAMDPFRRALEDAGFTDVESFGMSGNLIFTARTANAASIERRIARRFQTAAFVRTRAQLVRIAADDPFRAGVLLLARAPSASRRRAFERTAFEAPRPVLRGATVYFVHPARRRGTKTPFNFETALGVQGTARSARVVGRLLARMSRRPPHG